MTSDELAPEELTFEEAMETLESIVTSLESERLPLEEMVRSYERGAKLLGHCRSRIESARQRVELITADLEGRGRVTLSDFAAMEETTAPGATPAAGAESSKRPAPKKKPSADESEASEIRLF